MKKILIVASEEFRNPTSGYQVCVFNRYKALLDDGFEVTTLVFHNSKINNSVTSEGYQHYRKQRSYRGLIKCFYSLKPFFCDYYEGGDTLIDILEGNDFDYVIFEGLTATALYEEDFKVRFSDTKFIYCSHNVEFLLVKDIYRNRKFSYFLSKYLKFAIKKYEKGICRNVDKVVALSENDACVLHELSGRKVTTSGLHFSNEPNDSKTMICNDEMEKKIILLPTNFSHPPNLESFVKVVIPFSKIITSEFEIIVTGKDCGYFESHKFDNITYSGLVEKSELMDLYSKAYCALNPTISGGGVQIKLYEPLSYGCPIITLMFNLQHDLLGQITASSTNELFKLLPSVGNISKEEIKSEFLEFSNANRSLWLDVFYEDI